MLSMLHWQRKLSIGSRLRGNDVLGIAIWAGWTDIAPANP